MPSRIASAISKSLLGEGSVLPVLQSARQYQDVGSRLCRKIKTSHVLHDRIGRAGLQGATFNHESHQKVVESAYQSISEVRMLEKERIPYPTTPDIKNYPRRKKKIIVCDLTFSGKSNREQRKSHTPKRLIWRVFTTFLLFSFPDDVTIGW